MVSATYKGWYQTHVVRAVDTQTSGWILVEKGYSLVWLRVCLPSLRRCHTATRHTFTTFTMFIVRDKYQPRRSISRVVENLRCSALSGLNSRGCGYILFALPAATLFPTLDLSSESIPKPFPPFSHLLPQNSTKSQNPPTIKKRNIVVNSHVIVHHLLEAPHGAPG